MKLLLFLTAVLLLPSFSWAQVKVMNPGETHGQLVFLSQNDVLNQSPKFRSLSPYSIPVFAELPMELAVVAGTITLAAQNLLSHVQLKSRARGTPNLDLSELPGGIQHPLLASFRDGDWVYLRLTKNGVIGSGVVIEPSTPQAAQAFRESRQTAMVNLRWDFSAQKVLPSTKVGWQDFIRVGSKAANYAELAKALNRQNYEVVRPGHMVPFHFYQQFIDANPQIQRAIDDLLQDPLMYEIADVQYRADSLQELQNLMTSPLAIVNPKLLDTLLELFDQELDQNGLPQKMKLRSSTNAEDLPNFNGAGLYSSKAYKPVAKGVELSREEKRQALATALKTVWASTWNLRAFEEREYFRIPHKQVKMGIQINPSYTDELVDGVVVTKNVATAPGLTGYGVYIEAQRGDEHSVANPQPGVRSEKIFVTVDQNQKLDKTKYEIFILQKSNVADDMITVLERPNPSPLMAYAEIKELVYLSLKAEAHFQPLLDPGNAEFALDLEFKVDQNHTGKRQVYLKQARPYID